VNLTSELTVSDAAPLLVPGKPSDLSWLSEFFARGEEHCHFAAFRFGSSGSLALLLRSLAHIARRYHHIAKSLPKAIVT